MLRPFFLSETILNKCIGQCTGTKEGYGWLLKFQQVTYDLPKASASLFSS